MGKNDAISKPGHFYEKSPKHLSEIQKMPKRSLRSFCPQVATYLLIDY